MIRSRNVAAAFAFSLAMVGCGGSEGSKPEVSTAPTGPTASRPDPLSKLPEDKIKQAEPPKAEAAKPAEAPKADAKPAEPAKPAEAPKADAKPAEAPKADAKPAEAPKADAPKADAKPAAPKLESPK